MSTEVTQQRGRDARSQTSKVEPSASPANTHDVPRQLAQNAQFKAQMLQRRAAEGEAAATDMHAAAAEGVQGSGSALPHLDKIQRSFGHHDITGVQAYVGGRAGTAATAIGAVAFAMGNAVAFQDSPDVHTAAHEAAHVVQQRAGVQLQGGVGQAGDRYEQHADAVADRVVQGAPAHDLLDHFTGQASSAQPGVQRKEAGVSTEAAECGVEASTAPALNGERCDTQDPLTTSDPEQPPDIAAIVEKTRQTAVILDRLKEDVHSAILRHQAAAAVVGAAYTDAWAKQTSIASSLSGSPAAGIAIAIMNKWAGGLVSWFVGKLFGLSTNTGKSKAFVQQSALVAGTKALERVIASPRPKTATEAGLAAHTGPIQPVQYIAQLNLRTTTVVLAEHEKMMTWKRALRPVEDEPAAYPWFADADIDAFRANIEAWRAASPLMQAPNAIDQATLTRHFELYLWSDWLMKNCLRVHRERGSSPYHASSWGQEEKSGTFNGIPDEVIERVKVLLPGEIPGLGDVFDGDERGRLYMYAHNALQGELP